MKNFLIPNISQKIERILKRECLKPKISPKKFIEKTKGGKHRYCSLCKNPSEKKIIFYARIQKNKDAAKKVKKETALAIFFQKKNFQEKIPFLRFLPEYYKGKFEKDFEWFEREFIKENPLGDNEKLEKRPSKDKISKIVDFLSCLWKTRISCFRNIPLGTFPLSNYKNISLSIEKFRKEKIITEKEFTKGKEFIKKYINIFKKEHRYLSHGDFNLGNIIFTKKGLKVIDWESMEINNFAYDIAYLFCHLWQTKQWQRKYLIEKYLERLPKNKKEIFKILFRGNLLFLATGGIWAKPKEIKTAQLKKRKEFFKKITKASLRNFEEILLI